MYGNNSVHPVSVVSYLDSAVVILSLSSSRSAVDNGRTLHLYVRMTCLVFLMIVSLFVIFSCSLLKDGKSSRLYSHSNICFHGK